ncbi:MarR family winged helix-turn-helix transcriptional regulator [Williamsia phyllosphaerae]|uniref:MarR family transcriptional regulator n=1 Tax=Williamsia phyllosphaerae TaxID=885042 RepID=A0ABQ1UNB5_9NOCA|nr:MarR family transcriptional regulator [Williamsia phyllosphaerae]GGF21178.1 MarR family transcriptional regulator [Williamsia phyllosphaerae]
MSRLAHVDELIAVLSRYGRIKERLAVTKLKTPEGIVETAAYQCMFRLAIAPLRSGELAEQIFADPSTVSRHIAHLVDLGYVRREADPRDGRATILVLTDTGNRQVEAVRKHRLHALEAMLDEFSDDEIDNLTHLMSRFVDAAEVLAHRVDDTVTPDQPRHEEATR